MTEPQMIDWAHLRDLAQKANEIPPPGEYLLRCESAQWFSTKTGKPAIKAQYSVVDGPCAGMSVWNNQTLTTTSAVAVDIFLRFLGAHGIDPTQVQSNEQITKMMSGRHVEATIEHEEYNGRTMPRAKNFRQTGGQANAAPAAQPQPMAQPMAQPQPLNQTTAPDAQMPPLPPQSPQPGPGAQTAQLPVPDPAEGYLAGIPPVFGEQQQQQAQ